MGLKAKRAAAKARARTAKPAAPKPAAEPKPDTEKVTLAALAAISEQQQTLLETLQATITEQGAQLRALLERPLQVESGPVEVTVPTGQKARSFKIEYNQNGRPSRLIPEYETAH